MNDKMIFGNKIKKKLDKQDFALKMKCFNPDSIFCNDHNFFRFSEKQKEIYTCDFIKEHLQSMIPVLVGIQCNGNYAAFYKSLNRKIIRIIIEIKSNRINIVTFYMIDKKQLPVIK